jgi:hypothetical protein
MQEEGGMNRADGPGGTDRGMAIALFILGFVAYAFFAGGGGWNQNAHLALTRAIVEHGTLEIDAYREASGDLSYHAGHVYANKAPGLSFLAVPAYAVAYALERALDVDPSAPLTVIVNLWIVTTLTCGLAGSLIAPILFLYGRQSLGVSRAGALTVALCLMFGTYLFAYSTVLFAHVPSALFLLLAFVLRQRRPALAGVFAGVAGVCNYLCIPAALLLVLFSRSRRSALRIAAGGIGFGILLSLYHIVCFGSPFTSAVEASPAFTEGGAAFGVLVAPRLELLVAITLPQYRGLFYLSPVLLMAFAGAVVMWRRKEMRRELCLIAALVIGFAAFNISFNGWHGGGAIGPRYLLPIVPLLAIPMFFATAILRPLWLLLAVISCTFNLLATAVNPLPSKMIDRPLTGYIIPLYLTGHLPADTPPNPLWSWKAMLGFVSVNRQTPDELYPYTKHAPGSAASEWASFNLGELLLPGSRASIAFVVLWIVAGSGLLFRAARREAG